MPPKFRHQFFDVTSFSTFSYKNASVGSIFLKIGRIVVFDVKKPETSFMPVALAEDMAS